MHTVPRNEFQGVADALVEDASFDGTKGFQSDKKGLAGKGGGVLDIEMIVPIQS